MKGHYHTGIVAVAFAGVSAIVVIQLLRLGAALAVKSSYAPLRAGGAAVGGLVTFGGLPS